MTMPSVRRPLKASPARVLFFELAIEDLTQAADLFRPIHDATAGMDGWVSLEVSPLLAHDAANTIKAAAALRAQAHRRNLFIKIPGTSEGIAAIEESIFAGVPVNVTLLFSSAQYIAAAEAYLRGIERRIAAGLDPRVRSVASMFISRWDKAVIGKAPKELQDRLGIAIANAPTRRIANCSCHRVGLKPLMRASRSVCSGRAREPKTPRPRRPLCECVAAPDTINTIPEKTLLAFADHGRWVAFCRSMAATPKP